MIESKKLIVMENVSRKAYVCDVYPSRDCYISALREAAKASGVNPSVVGIVDLEKKFSVLPYNRAILAPDPANEDSFVVRTFNGR